MKLTDKRILELEGEYSHGYFDFTPEALIAFAHAVLKEAGVEELERDVERYKALRAAAIAATKGGTHPIETAVMRAMNASHAFGREGELVEQAVDEAFDEATKAK